MAKVIKFDLSGADEEVWEQGEGRVSEAPKPGIYQAKVHEINPGYSKDSDGEPDKSRPRLEVIYEIVGDAKGNKKALEKAGHDGGDATGAWVWDYVSFSKASEWKQAQFFKALGEGTPKKAKGKFNAEKHEDKTLVKIRIKADSYDGSYSAKVAATWPWEDPDDEPDEDLEDELDEELAADEDDDTSDDTSDDEDDFELDDEDEEEGITADDIREMSPAELKALAKEHKVSLKGLKKSAAVDALIEAVVGDEDVPF